MEKIISGKNSDGEEFSLYQMRVLEDNFTYLLAQDGVCLSVDPGDSKVIKGQMERIKCSLEGILITHSHEDHIAGVLPLKGEGKIPVLGPRHKSLPFLDQEVVDGDELSVGPFSMDVIHAPGHTMEHVMYFFRDLKLLFCGDVLFLGGCGKMIEGNEHHYFQTLEKIKALPGDTRLLVGHDYRQRNLEFIKFLTPSFSDSKMTENETFTTLKKEMSRNPFLSADAPQKFRELYDKREKFRSMQS